MNVQNIKLVFLAMILPAFLGACTAFRSSTDGSEVTNAGSPAEVHPVQPNEAQADSNGKKMTLNFDPATVHEALTQNPDVTEISFNFEFQPPREGGPYYSRDYIILDEYPTQREGRHGQAVFAVLTPEDTLGTFTHTPINIHVHFEIKRFELVPSPTCSEKDLMVDGKIKIRSMSVVNKTGIQRTDAVWGTEMPGFTVTKELAKLTLYPDYFNYTWNETIGQNRVDFNLSVEEPRPGESVSMPKLSARCIKL